MFSLANAKAAITNSEPHLTVPDVIYMSEDAGKTWDTKMSSEIKNHEIICSCFKWKMCFELDWYKGVTNVPQLCNTLIEL